MKEGDYVDSLISEYEIVLGKRFQKNREGEYDESGIVKVLSVSADWSVSGANESS